VATDVASRGLDIPDVDVVIHVGCRNVDSFVHRSGRTGRAGRAGKNFVIITRSELQIINKFARDLNVDMEIGCSLLENDEAEEQDLNVSVIKETLLKDAPANSGDKETEGLYQEFKSMSQQDQDQLVKLMLGSWYNNSKQKMV
jgi:superfamily II DNA/RNA helicase